MDKYLLFAVDLQGVIHKQNPLKHFLKKMLILNLDMVNIVLS